MKNSNNVFVNFFPEKKICLPTACQILACSKMIYEQIQSFFTVDKLILTGKKEKRRVIMTTLKNVNMVHTLIE